ncbi:MAG TPA: hypothetical protein VMU48_13510 [Terracidiphilus sp.]|nr:hypothetical protein [Terracidiphilus sp.]
MEIGPIPGIRAVTPGSAHRGELAEVPVSRVDATARPDEDTYSGDEAAEPGIEEEPAEKDEEDRFDGEEPEPDSDRPLSSDSDTIDLLA